MTNNEKLDIAALEAAKRALWETIPGAGKSYESFCESLDCKEKGFGNGILTEQCVTVITAYQANAKPKEAEGWRDISTESLWLKHGEKYNSKISHYEFNAICELIKSEMDR